MSTGLLPTLIRHLRRPTGANPPADAELVRRFAALRDGEAFEELLRRHGPLVWGVCRRRLPNRADAEDAFQSTFLVLAKRATAIRRPEALGCWLYGVAHRVAGRMRGRPVSAVPDELPSAAAPVVETATVREFLAALDEELLRLPEKLRGPLVLCFLQERTQDEAAKQLGVSLSTLKRRLDAGRELLRVRLSGRGVELSAALAAAGLAVPWSVADAAVQAALGGVSAGLVSANVITVTEGVVRAMTYMKLKAWTAGILMATAAVGGTGYFAATGSGQTGGTDPTARPTARQTSRPGPSDVADIRQAEVAVRVAEAELLKARAILTQSPEDRVAEAEVRLAEAKLEAAKVQLAAIQERAAPKPTDGSKLQPGDPNRLILPAEAAPKPTDGRKLQQEKLKAAKATLAYVLAARKQGRPNDPRSSQASAADVYDWSRRVLEAEREADPSAANRAKAAREHLDRMSQLERDQLERVRAGVADEQARAAATFYRLEAEVWVREAAAPRGRSPDGGAAAPELGPDGVQPLPQLEPPATPPVAPEGFRGTVRKVEGTTNDLTRGREVHVTLTPGADAGLQYGTVLTLYREAGGSGKYLGTVTIFRLDAKEALGRFTPADPRKVGADDLPKSGDELVPNIRSR